jgi:hypothetical protein
LGIISIIGYSRVGPLALLADDIIIGINFVIIAIIESGKGGHINRFEISYYLLLNFVLLKLSKSIADGSRGHIIAFYFYVGGISIMPII